MSRAIPVLAALAFALAPSVARGQDATMVFTEDGAKLTIAVDPAWLRCDEPQPAPPAGTEPWTTLVVSDAGRPSLRVDALRSGAVVYLLAPASGYCLASPDLVRAIGEARPAAGTRWPWLAFIASIGGLTVAIGLVALWGYGRGPEPTLGGAEAAEAEPHH